MNKQELSALVAQILSELPPSPQVKGGEYKPHDPGPQDTAPEQHPGDFVEDISQLDLRKLYLQEPSENKEAFAKLKERTPARLASGRAGARYKTVTMLRFRADHAAAQDAVFSQVPEDFAAKPVRLGAMFFRLYVFFVVKIGESEVVERAYRRRMLFSERIFPYTVNLLVNLDCGVPFSNITVNYGEV